MNAILAMQQLLSVIEGRLRSVAHGYGFRVEDLPVMGLVYANSICGSGLNAPLLAEHIGRSRQSVHVTLSRLAREGMVECWKRDNGWVGGWDPTEKGTRAWERLLEELAHIEGLVFKSDDQRRAAVAFFKSLREDIAQATWLFSKLKRERKGVRELSELRPGEKLSAEALHALLAEADAVVAKDMSVEPAPERDLEEGEREELVRLRREVEHYKAERLARYLVQPEQPQGGGKFGVRAHSPNERAPELRATTGREDPGVFARANVIADDQLVMSNDTAGSESPPLTSPTEDPLSR